MEQWRAMDGCPADLSGDRECCGRVEGLSPARGRAHSSHTRRSAASHRIGARPCESLCWVMGSQGAAWDRWVWMDTPGGSPGELGYQRKPSREGYGAKEGKPRVQCTQLMLLRLGSVTLPLAVGIRARPCKSHMAHSSCQA